MVAPAEAFYSGDQEVVPVAARSERIDRLPLPDVEESEKPGIADKGEVLPCGGGVAGVNERQHFSPTVVDHPETAVPFRQDVFTAEAAKEFVADWEHFLPGSGDEPPLNTL